MENEIIKRLSPDLECNSCKVKDNQIILVVASAKIPVTCPYCGNDSFKVHSVYQREIQDIPMQDRQTVLLLNTRKMFCTNSRCAYKTFTERFDFVEVHGKKTKRLIDKILLTSAKLSSVTASTLLKYDSIKASKSSICDLLKKNAGDCR